jgi:chromosome segregation ATPase
MAESAGKRLANIQAMANQGQGGSGSEELTLADIMKSIKEQGKLQAAAIDTNTKTTLQEIRKTAHNLAAFKQEILEANQKQQESLVLHETRLEEHEKTQNDLCTSFTKLASELEQLRTDVSKIRSDGNLPRSDPKSNISGIQSIPVCRQRLFREFNHPNMMLVGIHRLGLWNVCVM